MRLHLAHLGDVVGRRRFKGFVRCLVTIETPRLQAVERPFGAEQARQMPQVQHVAEHARHQEERCLFAAFAVVHRHQVDKAAPGGRGRAGFAGGGIRSTTGVADALADQRGAQGDGGCLEQHGNRELDPVGLLDHGEQAHRDQRMPAQVEEAVLDTHLIDSQELFPEADQRAFHIVARCHVVAVEVGTLEFLARCHIGLCHLAGLAHQRVQAHGRNDDLRQPRGQRTAKGVGAFVRQDALRHRVLELLFRR